LGELLEKGLSESFLIRVPSGSGSGPRPSEVREELPLLARALRNAAIKQWMSFPLLCDDDVKLVGSKGTPLPRVSPPGGHFGKSPLVIPIPEKLKIDFNSSFQIQNSTFLTAKVSLVPFDYFLINHK